MAKQLCEKTQRISIRFFRPKRSLHPWREHGVSSFSLSTTPCFFGGKRYWFLCPAEDEGKPCNRRVGVLYFIRGEYACRRCANLAYASQQKNHVGSRAIYWRYMKAEKALTKSFIEMRSRFHKGQPTKRYRKWLQRSEWHSASYDEFFRAEWKMLGITKFIANSK